jgi:hypothetical protein
MRRFLLALALSSLLLVGTPVSAPAQDKKDASPPAKVDRDGSTMFVPYTLGAVGIIIVMILVCMPVRRD